MKNKKVSMPIFGVAGDSYVVYFGDGTFSFWTQFTTVKPMRNFVYRNFVK